MSFWSGTPPPQNPPLETHFFEVLMRGVGSKIGRALHALTHDEWGAEPGSAAGGPGGSDDGGESDVSSVECDSSSDVDDELVAAM